MIAPSFLVNLITEQEYPVVDIEDLELSEENFTVYEIENLEPEPLLFQTGYITIHGFDNTLYQMGYPNQEVKTSFLSYLYRHFTGLKDKKIQSAYKRLHICLNEKNIEKFIDIVKSILGSIPYVQISGQGEDYYHTIFYLMLSASGVTVHTEMLTSKGRLDIAVEFDDKVYIIELKCNQSSQKAVQQILDKKYYEKYTETGREIYLMGINFDTEKRSIDDWQWGNLDDFLDKAES